MSRGNDEGIWVLMASPLPLKDSTNWGRQGSEEGAELGKEESTQLHRSPRMKQETNTGGMEAELWSALGSSRRTQGSRRDGGPF